MEQEVKEIQNRNTVDAASLSDDAVYPEFYLNDDQLQELQDFCHSFNPYEEPSLEDKLRLKEFGVTDFNNPFEVTNKLLLLLENNIQFRDSSTEA